MERMVQLARYRLRSRSAVRAVAGLVAGVSLAVDAFAILLRSADGAIVFGALACIGGWQLLQSRWRENGTLDLEPGGIVVRGHGVRASIPRESIVDGFDAGDDKLFLRTRAGATLEATTSVPPREILNHLGVSLERRTLRAPLRAALGSFTRGFLAFFGVGIFGNLFALRSSWPYAFEALYAVATLFTIAVVLGLRPAVVVGLDGVRIVGVLRPRFIPYTSIRRVRRGSSVTLETDRGNRELPMIGVSSEQMNALAARIEEGMRRSGAASARGLDMLDRNERPLAAWAEAIASAMRGTFRDAAIAPGNLEQVLADPKAPLERRVGAALGLRAGEDGRARIRVAAETSADPRVRVALERAAADEIDEHALLHALGER